MAKTSVLRSMSGSTPQQIKPRDVRQSLPRDVRQSVPRGGQALGPLTHVPPDILVATRAPGPARVSILFAGAALALLALPACAPLPAADPSVNVRDSAEGGDAEQDADAADPAPAAAEKVGPLTWVSSETDAVAQSKAERRPMLLSFASEWCSACKRLAQETFGDPRVKTQAGRFVAVRIDATNDDDPQVSAALSKYAVIGVPTVILFDSSGHEQRRFTDFIRPDTLLGEIEQVR